MDTSSGVISAVFSEASNNGGSLAALSSGSVPKRNPPRLVTLRSSPSVAPSAASSWAVKSTSNVGWFSVKLPNGNSMAYHRSPALAPVGSGNTGVPAAVSSG